MNKFYSIFFLFFLIACKVNELEYSLMKANEYAQKGEYEKALEFAKNASKGAPKNTKAIDF